jgi:uncharacterized Zn finger protein
MSWNYYREYSGPRATRAGIKAKSARGKFGQTKIGMAWERLIGSDSRISKARSYARKGQVIDMSLDAGEIKGSIQGSRSTPYTGFIHVAIFSPQDWLRWLDKVASSEDLVAELLNDQLSERAEELIREVMGKPLVPGKVADLTFECSCPDYAEPCKHVAALHLLTCEQLDDRPTLMLMLRGLDLDHMRATLTRATLAQRPPSGAHAKAPVTSALPLPIDPDAFWARHSTPLTLNLRARLPASPEAILGELGPPPLWHAERALGELLAPVYQAAQHHGLELLGVHPEETPEDS